MGAKLTQVSEAVEYKILQELKKDNQLPDNNAYGNLLNLKRHLDNERNQ